MVRRAGGRHLQRAAAVARRQRGSPHRPGEYPGARRQRARLRGLALRPAGHVRPATTRALQTHRGHVVRLHRRDREGSPQADTTHSALHQATTQAYRQICATLDAESYPHLLRVWNYLPDINVDAEGTERYRQFNTARQDALRASGRALTRQRAGSLRARCAERQPGGGVLPGRAHRAHLRRESPPGERLSLPARVRQPPARSSRARRCCASPMD